MKDNNIQNEPDNLLDVPAPAPPIQADEEKMDTANKSLADALRLSFRLLSFFMIGVVVLFFFTGLTQIDTNQCGVKLLLGRIQGDIDKHTLVDTRVLGPGLRWSVPEPIGRVMKIPTGQQKVDINDFWIHETPEDALRPLRDRRVPQGGLRPGWDGSLLTGDRGLVHVKLTCFYSFPAKKAKTSQSGGPDPSSVMQLIHNIAGMDLDEEGVLKTRRADEAVRSAVCSAAICAAATRTVESIYPTGQKDFADAVAEIAQQRLNKFNSGIRIERIEVPDSTVPLAAIAAFDAVSNAATERDKLINKAKGLSNEMLSAAAGGSYKKLTGDHDKPGDAGLLQSYAKARENGLEIAAAEELQKINRLLVSNQTGGGAARIINEAKSYSATIRQRVEARAGRFEKLIDKFLATPDLMLQRLWAEKKEEILTAPTVMKYYITPGKKTVLRINEDPEVRRQRDIERLKTRPGPGGRESRKR